MDFLSFYNDLDALLYEQNLRLVMTSIFGSHKFGLQNKLSDYDFFVVYAHPKYEYLSWSNDYTNGEELKFNGVDVELMDLKRYFQLVEKSNFSIYQTTYGAKFHNEFQPFYFTNGHFNYKKVLHHLLGLVYNNKHRTYVSCYAWMLAEWIYHFQTLPTTLDYSLLFNDLKDILHPDSLERMWAVFTEKKLGYKDLTVELFCELQHTDVELLPEKDVENIEKMWFEYWKNMK